MQVSPKTMQIYDNLCNFAANYSLFNHSTRKNLGFLVVSDNINQCYPLVWYERNTT